MIKLHRPKLFKHFQIFLFFYIFYSLGLHGCQKTILDGGNPEFKPPWSQIRAQTQKIKNMTFFKQFWSVEFNHMF